MRWSTPTNQVVAAMAAADRHAAPAEPTATREPSDEPTVRGRWDEAGGTSRLNSAQWSGVSGRPINEDLAGRLPTLRARCHHECARNPMVEGIINTMALNLVGPEGPALTIDPDSQTETDSEADAEWAKQAVAIWKDFFARPTICGTITGPMLLQMWIRGFWLDGEALTQLVTDPTKRGVQTRLKPIDPSLLRNPLDRNRRNVALGVERDDHGRPTTYHVAEYQYVGEYRLGGYKTRPLPADVILHDFIVQEPDQVRGVPWLAPSLKPAADLRDYDEQVLDAARAAAEFSVLMWTNHPDAPYFLVNDQTTMERRTIKTMPPGYQAEQLKPEQPTTQYVDYRRERLAELGRPVNMPLMLIRLTAERHNYSSARLDMQQYASGLAAYQAWIGATLTRLLKIVLTEAFLAGQIGPAPKKWTAAWGWPKMPHVDPVKEATAERTRMESGTLTYQDACTANGQDVDLVIAKRVADAKKLAEAGLPPVPTPGSATGAMAAAPQDDDDDELDDDDDEQDADEQGASSNAQAAAA
jgi:lambda family phage portal protein